jgi:hypothetical protein
MDDTQRSFLFETEHASRWETGPMLSEIESVARKAKSMSVFTITQDMLGGEFYVELIKKSIDMGIMVAIHKRFNGTAKVDSEEILLFFLPGEESWRIPAYLSMNRAFFDDPWSDGLETLQSFLLGYSESQIKSWIDDHNRKRIGWLGTTCYFLVSHAQRNAISRLANRCIDPSSIAEDIEVFYNTDNVPPKENAHELLPERTYLCRASIKFGFFKRLFAHDISSGRKVPFFVSAINSSNASDLNESLQSNFQFLGD